MKKLEVYRDAWLGYLDGLDEDEIEERYGEWAKELEWWQAEKAESFRRSQQWEALSAYAESIGTSEMRVAAVTQDLETSLAGIERSTAHWRSLPDSWDADEIEGFRIYFDKWADELLGSMGELEVLVKDLILDQPELDEFISNLGFRWRICKDVTENFFAYRDSLLTDSGGWGLARQSMADRAPYLEVELEQADDE